MPLTKTEFRKLFLKEFILNLIEQSMPEIPEEERETPRKEIKEEKKEEIKPKTPEIKKAKEESAEERLNKLIEDEEVDSIECSGPEKQLIVNKSGEIHPINVTFSKEEINSLVKKFSEKSNTPIKGGMLRARLDGKSITALISEYIGTRFMIQKD